MCAPDLIDQVQPALAGWMGHEAPFAMDRNYRPAMTTERLRIGTPPIIQLSILSEALKVWDGVDMADIRAASLSLSELFIQELEQHCPSLRLASPREGNMRGSQVSFAFDHGYAAMQALIERGVIGDFRAPDIMRFGFTPLYVNEKDVVKAAQIIEDVIANNLWRDPKYHNKSRVT